MATTDKNYTLSGNPPAKGPYSFEFPYLNAKDVQVELNGVRLIPIEEEDLTSNPTKPHKFTRQTTQITLVDDPASGDKLRIYRVTDDSNITATFYPGSAIKSGDLNDNFTQNLYTTQENTNDAATALNNSRVLESGTFVTAIDRANVAKDATDTLVGTKSGSTWTLKGGGTTAQDGSDPKGVKYAVETADDSILATDAFVAKNTAAAGQTPVWVRRGNAGTDSTGASDPQSGVGKAITDSTQALNTANAALPKAGGTMTGDITLGQSRNVVFEGSSDDDYETTLTVANPTGSDKTITLPNVTGTVVTTGDTGTVTTTMLDASAVVTNSEQAANGYSANDTSFFTTSASDARYFNISSGDTIKDGVSPFPDNDTTIATTAAINDRIIDLVDDVGGFVPLVSEATFPAANPDVNNGAGTIVSIGVLGASYTPSSGTCTIPDSTLTNISGSNVTITDCGTTVLAAGYGCLVETTTTLHTYKFHRLTPKATEVTTVAGNITNINTVAGSDANITTVAGNNTNINTVAGNNSNITTVAGKITDVETVSDNITDVSNFADLYQIAASAPTTDGGNNALAAGDLWFDSSSNKTLKVHNGTTFTSVSPTQSVLDDISIVSGSLTRQEDLGSIADAISTGTGTGSLDTCATNITNINAFANTYFIASSAPTGSTVGAGDLWYDSTGSTLKYNNGTSWVVTASEGMSELSEDTTPTLGGPLDCDEKEISNIKLDFGSLT